MYKTLVCRDTLQAGLGQFQFNSSPLVGFNSSKNVFQNAGSLLSCSCYCAYLFCHPSVYPSRQTANDSLEAANGVAVHDLFARELNHITLATPGAIPAVKGKGKADAKGIAKATAKVADKGQG